MIELSDIHPLTDFKRNSAEFRRRLKKSGRPTVLTVEGRPELVVQDAAAYQRMLDALDHAESIAGIRRGLADVEAGRTGPAAAMLRDVRARLGLEKRNCG